jgi:hypothetical protein
MASFYHRGLSGVTLFSKVASYGRSRLRRLPGTSKWATGDGEYVDDFQRVIAEPGNEQSLTLGIRRKVIDSSSHAGNRNLFFQLQRKNVSPGILTRHNF